MDKIASSRAAWLPSLGETGGWKGFGRWEQRDCREGEGGFRAVSEKLGP